MPTPTCPRTPCRGPVSPSAAEGASDVHRRLADMDAEGIDVQVLYGGLAIGTTTFSDAGFAADFAQAYNDWLLDEVCGHAPDRLLGVAAVPLQDVDRSIAELQRAGGRGAV